MKKKFLFKSLLGAGLATFAMLGLAGCNKNSNNNNTTETSAVEPAESSNESTPVVTPTKKEYTVNLVTDEALDVKSYTVEAGSVIKLPKLIKDGYTFLGWYTSDDDKVSSITGIFTNMDLYPKFLKNKEEMTFNYRGELRTVDPEENVYDNENIYSVLYAYVSEDGAGWPVPYDAKFKDLNPNLYYKAETSYAPNLIETLSSKSYFAKRLATIYGIDPTSDADDEMFETCEEIMRDFITDEMQAEYKILASKVYDDLVGEYAEDVPAKVLYEKIDKLVVSFANRYEDKYNLYLKELMKELDSLFEDYASELEYVAKALDVNQKDETNLTDESLKKLFEILDVDYSKMSVVEIIKFINELEDEKYLFDGDYKLNDDTILKLTELVNDYDAFYEFSERYFSVGINRVAYEYVMANEKLDFSTLGSTSISLFKLSNKIYNLSTTYNYEDYGLYEYYDMAFSIADEYVDNTHVLYYGDNVYKLASNIAEKSFESLSIANGGVFYSYSKNRVNKKSIESIKDKELLAYLDELGLSPEDMMRSVFNGVVNDSDINDDGYINYSNASSYVSKRYSTYSSLIQSYMNNKSSQVGNKYSNIQYTLDNTIGSKNVDQVYVWSSETNKYLVFTKNGSYYSYSYQNGFYSGAAIGTVNLDKKTITVTSKALTEKYSTEEKIKMTLSALDYKKLSLGDNLGVYYDSEYNQYIKFGLSTKEILNEDESVKEYEITLNYNGTTDNTSIYNYNYLTLDIDFSTKTVKSITSPYGKYNDVNKVTGIEEEGSYRAFVEGDGYGYIYLCNASGKAYLYNIVKTNTYTYNYYKYGENYYLCKLGENNTIVAIKEDEALAKKYEGKYYLDSRSHYDSDLYYYDKDAKTYIHFVTRGTYDNYYFEYEGTSTSSYGGLLVSLDSEKKILTADITYTDALYRKYHIEITGDANTPYIYVKQADGTFNEYVVYKKNGDKYVFYSTCSRELYVSDFVEIDFTNNTFKVTNAFDTTKLLEKHKGTYAAEDSTEYCKYVNVSFYDADIKGSYYILFELTEDGYKAIAITDFTSGNYCFGSFTGDNKINVYSHNVYHYKNEKRAEYSNDFEASGEAVKYLYVNTSYEYAYYEYDSDEAKYKFVEFVDIITDLDSVYHGYKTYDGKLYVSNYIEEYFAEKYASLTFHDTYYYTLMLNADKLVLSSHSKYIAFKCEDGQVKYDHIYEDKPENYIEVYANDEYAWINYNFDQDMLDLDKYSDFKLEFEYAGEDIYLEAWQYSGTDNYVYVHYTYNHETNKYDFKELAESYSKTDALIKYNDSYKSCTVYVNGDYQKADYFATYFKSYTYGTNVAGHEYIFVEGYVGLKYGIYIAELAYDGIEYYSANGVARLSTANDTVLNIDSNTGKLVIDTLGDKSKAVIEEIKTTTFTSEGYSDMYKVTILDADYIFEYSESAKGFIYNSKATYDDTNVGIATIDYSNKKLIVVSESKLAFYNENKDVEYTLKDFTADQFTKIDLTFVLTYKEVNYTIAYDETNKVYKLTGEIYTDDSYGEFNIYEGTVLGFIRFTDYSAKQAYIKTIGSIANSATRHLEHVVIYDYYLRSYLHLLYNSSENSYHPSGAFYETRNNYVVVSKTEDGKIYISESIFTYIDYLEGLTITVDDAETLYNNRYLIRYNNYYFVAKKNGDNLVLLSTYVYTGVANFEGVGNCSNDTYLYCIGELGTVTDSTVTTKTIVYSEKYKASHTE